MVVSTYRVLATLCPIQSPMTPETARRDLTESLTRTRLETHNRVTRKGLLSEDRKCASHPSVTLPHDPRTEWWEHAPAMVGVTFLRAVHMLEAGAQG